MHNYSYADPYGTRNDSSYDNPTTGRRKCIIAEVTMTYDNADTRSAKLTESRRQDSQNLGVALSSADVRRHPVRLMAHLLVSEHFRKQKH